MNWGDAIDLNNDGTNLAGEPDLPTDTETTYGASIGLDIGLGRDFAIIGGVRYLKLDLTPEGEDDGVPSTRSSRAWASPSAGSSFPRRRRIVAGPTEARLGFRGRRCRRLRSRRHGLPSGMARPSRRCRSRRS